MTVRNDAVRLRPQKITGVRILAKLGAFITTLWFISTGS